MFGIAIIIRISMIEITISSSISVKPASALRPLRFFFIRNSVKDFMAF